MKAIAPTNIAVVKYWGKNPFYKEYNIPTKSSFSLTVDSLYTETEVEIEKGNGSISLELNGREINETDKEMQYIKKFFDILSSFSDEFGNYDYFIKTKNNFPTAAGFASSASGFAALAKALSKAFSENERLYKKFFSDDKKLSSIAMLGSGSASRSIPSRGGFVLWRRGYDPMQKEDFSLFKSYSETIFAPEHWKEMNIVYLKLSEGEKKIKSRRGMQITLETNPLYWDWVNYEENYVLPGIIEAVKEKNSSLFFEYVMKCSDALHAMMRYSYPPIIYTNDLSHQIIEKIVEFNAEGTRAAYTFDAGANAVLFVEDKNKNELISSIKEVVEGRDVFETKLGVGSR